MSYNVQPLRTNEEIQDFQFWLRRTSNPERDSFLFLFGINNGLRMSDIIGLKVGDIRGKSKPIIVERKTGKRKPIFIDNLREEILLYTEGKEENDWLFPSRQQGRHITRDRVYQIYADIAEKLGRDDIGTHTLRKTFGYHYYKKTRDIATLMFIFNHSSQAITKRYIGITEDEIGASLRGFKLGV
ncbi:tyrosine-type recombinase/integrase [Enterococcus faecium]|uniref:tyrosine-type recombinase/integrase n=1 Tax=Enterococcus faecium TaxID=1352 RepID=UPI000F4FFBC8|nr:tyrosine-type recombinase/integrase [Enterococcus faecium]NRE80774.1 tyrosine-type recombinase/integrase [Enterococcus faecium]ROX52326.1 integrase [Enterococcus faecium]